MPKQQTEVSIWIACSPEAVWDYLCDVSNEVLWRYGVLFSEWVTDPPHGIGSIGYHFVQSMGDYPWQVAEWEEPEHISWNVIDGRFKGAYAGYRVSPEDDGSRMTIYIDANKSFLVKMMTFMMQGIFVRQLTGDLERLKAILENQTT